MVLMVRTKIIHYLKEVQHFRKEIKTTTFLLQKIYVLLKPLKIFDET